MSEREPQQHNGVHRMYDGPRKISVYTDHKSRVDNLVARMSVESFQWGTSHYTISTGSVFRRGMRLLETLRPPTFSGMMVYSTSQMNLSRHTW
jgi:hypothetical protein